MRNFVYAAAAMSAAGSGDALANGFPGARLEAQVGWDRIGAKASFTDSANSANNVSDKRSADGVLVGVEFGYDAPVGNGGYVGVLGGVDFSTAKKCEAVLSTSRACFKGKHTFAVGGRAGLRASKASMMYVGAAYVNSRATVSYTDTATPANSGSISESRGGYRVFAGYEHRIARRAYAKVEYRYSDYANYTASFGSQSA